MSNSSGVRSVCRVFQACAETCAVEPAHVMGSRFRGRSREYCGSVALAKRMACWIVCDRTGCSRQDVQLACGEVMAHERNKYARAFRARLVNNHALQDLCNEALERCENITGFQPGRVAVPPLEQ